VITLPAGARVFLASQPVDFREGAHALAALAAEVLADWLGTAALEIRPVVRRLREILLAWSRLFADETTLPVLDPGRGKVKKGFAWALARDDRRWGGIDPRVSRQHLRCNLRRCGANSAASPPSG
jgi:hypothetical protein